MIELSSRQLRRLQLVELELLREVDRICTKNGIHYNIIAGTLLGAVRHGGFIPWDDDADVALLRDEYERFRTACETDLDTQRFEFQDDRATPGYRWGYGKLRRKGTAFVREHQEHMPYDQGVFIDVFPLDPVPQGRMGRTWWNLRCWLVRKSLWARVGKVADASGFKRAVYRLLDSTPEEKVLGRLHRLVERSSRIDSDWVRILMFPTPTSDYGYLRRWYEASAPTTFEGVEFSGIADYEGYLSFKFGAWRELPPASQRKTHPVSTLLLPEEVDA